MPYPYHPMKDKMEKLDQFGFNAMAKLKDQKAAGTKTSMKDRLDMSRTAADRRWDQTAKARKEEEQEEAGQASNTSATASSSRGAPPHPPSRSTASSTLAGPSPLPPSRANSNRPTPALPPRMANEAGTNNPPPAYGSVVPPPAPPSRKVSTGGNATFKWSQISQADKQAFFELLDEFFAELTARTSSAPIPGAVTQPRPPSFAPKPLSAKPPSSPSIRVAPVKSSAPVPASTGSYPLLTASSKPYDEESTARTLVDQFMSKTGPEWTLPNAWYAQSPYAPSFVVSHRECTRSSSIQWVGTERTVVGHAAFQDLSVLWYSVSWSEGIFGNSGAKVKVAVRDPPAPLDAARLYSESQRFGEEVARFVETCEGSSVGDGECWTLAQQALVQLNATSGLTGPYAVFEPISYTLGHLVYAGEADAGGRWRGGDYALRRGDILQWKSARCSHVHSPAGSYVDLGAPDHTAVLLSDASAPEWYHALASAADPHDAPPMAPQHLGHLTVMEQSARSVCSRTTYDLSTLSRGNLHVFRPVSYAALGGKPDNSFPSEGKNIKVFK
ncbi:hypothetical protein IE81DRAFT_322980 [Ceraceosorus guamensis]|uniref:BBC1/AIM3 cysteine proteinase-fold domain-containing protein n=1 Tax=Ceraceosorus guamensis TaxID=1522189 RepID=A0A316VZF0_9BASI|nr:hypothetical protein IE81DRAFT_322980 [Ceraceosorus guamensis]PWN42842.1 hypothetical protein IE81DRAFT_322980 [Ceraceosorus guamensis]